jgi:hypothetical protein
MQKVNLVFVAVGAVVVLLFGFLLYQNHDLRKQQDRLIAEIRQQGGGGDKEGRREDPYRAKAVKNTVTKYAGEIQTCYNDMISRKIAKTDGKVKLDWRIVPSGKVIAAGIVFSEIGDDVFNGCMIKKISSWEFPQPPFGEEYYVEHTFTFKKEAT